MNNMNLEALKQTKQKLQQMPEAAIATKAANISWQSGLKHDIEVGTYHFTTDMPEHIGGNATHSGPGGYLLGAIGSCLATTFEMLATEDGVTLDSVNITLEGTINPAVFLGISEGYAGYSDLTARFKVQSDATREVISELAETAANRSPVVASLSSKINIVIED